MNIVIRVICLWLCIVSASATENVYVMAKAKARDKTEDLFLRYEIDHTPHNIKLFRQINTKSTIPRSGALLADKLYALPVRIVHYAGEPLVELLSLPSEGDAALIEQYNDRMRTKGLRRDDFRVSGNVWVPMWMTGTAAKKHSKNNRSYHRLFGKGYSVVEKVDNALEGHVFYIDPGHGGPDPGAIGKRGTHELHEDEYAYDVSLRLARNFLSHGATVYVIVQEMKDGIRDTRFLNNSDRERYYGGQPIARGHRERLENRAAIINKLFDKHAGTATAQHSVTIHVDSRTTAERIDIFFYHAPGSERGKTAAETLLQTMREKYNQAQPGRGYNGSVEARDLFMLNNSKPIGTYIELGNIKNPNDQVRLIEPRNRQAIADWLCDGYLALLQKQKK